MNTENLKTITIILLTAFLLLGYISEEKTSKIEADNNVEITEDIKLYSNGKLIGEWQGFGRGTMRGNTYVFETGRGSFSDEIRISGDFVVKTNTD